MAIAATRDGKVVYTGAFGVRSLVTHLPYFRLADERYKNITIRQMLNHTSGMPDVHDYEWDKPQYDEGAAERYVRSLSGEKMVSAPGEEFHYSDMAFDVLGDVIAKFSGKPFEIYMKQHILNPLGMKETSFLREEIRKDLRTASHTDAIKPVVSAVYPYNRPHAPSSTLNSSVVEMGHWAIANINQGEFQGKRILKEESHSLLWTPTAKVDQQHQIGLSRGLWSYKGERAIGHGGGDLGYRSYLLLLPDKRIGLVLASNYDRTPMDEIASGVMDILLGYKLELPKKTIAKEFFRVLEKERFAAAKSDYFKIVKEAKDEFRFTDREFNRLGYYYLEKQDVEKVIEVLKFNVELYPTVSNASNSLGEAYLTAGQKEKAIQNYEKALELDPKNNRAAEQLKKLKGGHESE